MSILTRYVLKEMTGPTALGFLFYTMIILMQRLFDMAGMIIRGSLSGSAVGKLLLGQAMLLSPRLEMVPALL